MTTLPTGTVTFLFTDIEGSTRLLESLGTGYQPILERHHVLLRDAIASGQGTEISTEGDAFFAVFSSAPSAVAAVTAAQRSLTAEPWPANATVRVRMGLHSGEGVLGGDSYVGLDVHRAARVASAGHGGQVLLSGSTHALAIGNLPSGVVLADLGEHRLKDLSRPEHLWQLSIEGLPSAFPPPKTLEATPNNLPLQLTSFLGRQREVDEVTALVNANRLITMTGPGGTGKTRLALQVAAEASDRFPDGVYFVALEPITRAELLLPTIAQAVGLVDAGAATVERLAEHFGDKSFLLVLDNFEQVDDAAPLVADLLSRAPHLTILATSRSPLRVYGEREFPVPPLGLPDPRNLPDLDRFSQFESVALFVERAVAVRPDFAVDNDNAPAVAEICVRLDGLPLAIELAAARVRVLTPQAILDRLTDRLASFRVEPAIFPPVSRRCGAPLPGATTSWNPRTRPRSPACRSLPAARVSMRSRPCASSRPSAPPPLTRSAPLSTRASSVKSPRRAVSPASTCSRRFASSPRSSSRGAAAGTSSRRGTPPRFWPPWKRCRPEFSARTAVRCWIGSSSIETTFGPHWPGPSNPPRPRRRSAWSGHAGGIGRSGATSWRPAALPSRPWPCPA
jgi:class 3 adenylate cyclase